MDLDARLGGELGDLHRLQEYGHTSPVPGAQQPVALGEQVGGSHHVVQMQGLEDKVTKYGKMSTSVLTWGALGSFPPTYLPPNLADPRAETHIVDIEGERVWTAFGPRPEWGS